MKEVGGKRRVSRTGPALGGWGHGSRGPVPTWVPLEAEETVQGTEEKHSRLRVKQLICESLNGMRITETILAAAICSLGRGMQGRKVPWKAQGWELEHRDCGAIRGELSY